MKLIKIIICVFLVCITINFSIPVFAISSGFVFETISDDSMDDISANIGFTFLPFEPGRRGIECFDVSDKGLIAIGTSKFDNKYVCVYDSDGVYQYGYGFDFSGSFGFEWDDDNINLYIVRGNYAISITPIGEINNVYTVLDTESNNSYWNYEINATERVVGDVRYSVKNNMGILNFISSSHSQLIIDDGNGETRVIYDVNDTLFVERLMVVAFFIAFGATVIFLIIRNIIKSSKMRKSKQT